MKKPATAAMTMTATIIMAIMIAFLDFLLTVAQQELRAYRVLLGIRKLDKLLYPEEALFRNRNNSAFRPE